MKLAVTGAGGFIGGALVRVAREAGHTALGLKRPPVIGPETIAWRLGEPLPPAAADADVVVHLASAVLGARAPQAALTLDLEGSRTLIEDLRRLRRAGGGPRLLFVSSQSADPAAANTYGRSKFAIEAMLDEPGEIIVRPGLVYGDAPVSVYAALARLAALPVVPVVSAPAAIHPIHVDDLCACLLQIAADPQAERLWMLGSAPAMTLQEVLAGAARREGRPAPAFVPLPRLAVRLAARTLDLALRPSQSLLERVDGLIGLKPMDCAPSLARLGRALRPF